MSGNANNSGDVADVRDADDSADDRESADSARNTPPAHPIRTASPDDEPFLRQLQGLLPEPSPELLSFGLSAGTVLVTTAQDLSAHSDLSPATVTPPLSATGIPVGYLLPIYGAGTHLAELVVAPSARRQGRASALLAMLLAQRPDGERVTLSVAGTNEAAQSLYRSFGFEQQGSSETLYEAHRALLFERIV